MVRELVQLFHFVHLYLLFKQSSNCTCVLLPLTDYHDSLEDVIAVLEHKKPISLLF